MSDGPATVWFRRHLVLVYSVIAVLWLAFGIFQFSQIRQGNAGSNGGHVFGMMLALLAFALFVGAAVIYAAGRRRRDDATSEPDAVEDPRDAD